MDAARQQARAWERLHIQRHQANLDRYTAHKPELKEHIAILSQQRDLIDEEIRQLETALSNVPVVNQIPPILPSAAARPGSTSHFAQLSDVELKAEQARLQATLLHIDGQVMSTKAVFAQPRREQERDIWEAQLIILQDTRRMHQEEIDSLEVEGISRARVRRLAHEQALAEQSGLAQLAQLKEQLNDCLTRLNELKRELYFPDVKGYSFSFGGRGIYFGGKDVLLSELSGAFAISAEAGQADKQGLFKSARITMQFGGAHLASAQRGSTSQAAAANRAAAVTQSFQLRPSSAKQPPAPATASAPAPAPAPARHSASAAPPAPSAADSFAHTSGLQPPLHSSSAQQAELPQHAAKQMLPRPVLGNHSQQQQQQQQPQPHAGQQQQQQQQQQRQSDTLSLHQSDVYSPLQASAPNQGSGLPDSQSERRASSSHASSSAGQGASGAPLHHGVLPPRAPAEQHQSRSKRLASKLLKKMGTKERFRNPHADAAASGWGGQAGRTAAYSPDAFDDVPKKGKLAQRLLGGSKGVSGKLVFGSHVAGKHHKWAEPLDAAGFEGVAAGSMHAAEVQQDVLEAAAEAEGDPQTPRTTEDLEYDLAATPRQTSEGGPGLGPLPQEGTPQHLSRASSTASQVQAQASLGEEVDLYRQQPNINSSRQFARQDSAPSSTAAGKEGAAAFKGAFKKVANGIAGGDFWEGSTERGSEAGVDSASGSGGRRKGLFVVVRLSDVGLIGEKGTKVPNASIAEISVEVELCLTFTFDFTSVQGWHTAVKPVFEVVALERKALGASVPLPKTIIRYILSAVLPRVLQRKLLGLLPRELGQYLLDVGQGGRLAGEITIVGPALSSLDAELAFKQEVGARSKDARRQAQANAAAQEARGMLGMSLDQAQVLSELFSGRAGLVATLAPCNMAQLQAYYSRHHEDSEVWAGLCDAWDSALHILAQPSGAAQPLSFRGLMEGHIAHHLLKPVRARLTLNQASVSIGADAVLTAIRDFGERTARETCAREEATGRKEEGSEPLDVQLQVLESVYTFAAGKLHTFKAKFKHATGSLVAQANARNYALGVEGVSYEGPLRVRLPVKKRLDPDGSFSFEIPLPNPDRQVLLKRFAGGFKQALSSPLSVQQVATQIASQTMSSHPSAGSEAAASDGDSEEEALPDWGHDKTEKPPLKLGKVIVDGMRVRVRLDQQRISSLLAGISPETMGGQFADVASGVLSMLGDMASLSFARYHTEDGSEPHFVLNMESSDVSNLNAELAQLGFRSGEGVSPGRTLRIVQAISRAVLLTTGMSKSAVKGFDAKFDSWHRHLTKETLDLAVCIAAESSVRHKSNSEPLMVHVSGTSDDAAGTKPMSLTNEVELVSMIRSIRGDAPSRM